MYSSVGTGWGGSSLPSLLLWRATAYTWVATPGRSGAGVIDTYRSLCQSSSCSWLAVLLIFLGGLGLLWRFDAIREHIYGSRGMPNSAHIWSSRCLRCSASTA